MIRTFTFVIVIALCSVGPKVFGGTLSVAARFGDVRSARIVADADTTAYNDPAISFQNLVYKSRLDSIENAVPLNYNEYVQGYINTYLARKEQIGKMLGLSKYYFPIFEKVLKEAGLPDELKFITVIESALNPHAVSRSGAVGPWQFMYTTAKGYGLVMDNYVDERKDPVKASYAAAHYFVDSYKRIGDWLLTIAAFNCGTGAVTRAIERSGGIADFWKVRPFLPVQTQNYVPAFIATVYAMNYYKNHGIVLKPADFNTLTDVVQVNRQLSISKVAQAADIDLKELLALNPSYKKQIINGSVGFPKSLVLPGVNSKVYVSLYDLLNGDQTEKNEIYQASVSNIQVVRSELPDYHRVQPGQNLNTIAEKYGMSSQDLKAWNKMKSATVVPGQTIRLSSQEDTSQKSDKGYMSYIVKVGDTLSGIAEKFNGLTVSKIKALNGLTRSTISPGMRLIVNRL